MKKMRLLWLKIQRVIAYILGGPFFLAFGGGMLIAFGMVVGFLWNVIIAGIIEGAVGDAVKEALPELLSSLGLCAVTCVVGALGWLLFQMWIDKLGDKIDEIKLNDKIAEIKKGTKHKPHHSSYHNDWEDSSYSYSYDPPSKTLTSKDHDDLDALLEDIRRIDFSEVTLEDLDNL